MKTAFRTLIAIAFLSQAALAQDPIAAFQKRVEEASKSVSDRFVFLPGGSGVFISEDGWLLTNHHVIAPPDSAKAELPRQVDVWLADARRFKAKLVCTDMVGDIALLKIELNEGKVPFVQFADSDKVQTGQYAIACGNPFGMANFPAADGRYYPSISLGIVSCVHRYQQQYTDTIQTDAAVNPGNSGGPLVDLEGKLLGINGRIATRYGNRVNSGVGYAIPANQIAHFVPEMKKGGIERRIYHGQVNGLDFNPKHMDGNGALVEFVQTNSNADHAGFKKGDLVVAVNGSKVTSVARYLSLIGMYPNETELSVTVARDGKNTDVKVLLDRGTMMDITGKAPSPKGNAWLGITFEDAKGGGVEVELVTPDSPAENAEIKVGDVILEVDGKKIIRREIMKDYIDLKNAGNTLKLKIRRSGKEIEISVTLGDLKNKPK